MKELKELGLPHYEAKALEILLKNKATPKELSKMAEIPLGKVYSIISSLKNKNLVKETTSRPKYIYIENPSKTISKLIEQKRTNDEGLFTQLRTFATEISKSKSKTSPFFQIGTNQEHNKEIQLRVFTEAEKEVCQIINIHHKPKSNRANKTLWEKEIKNAINRGVIFKAIYPKNIKLPELLEKLPKSKFKIKNMDTDFPRIDIIDKKKVLIKLVHEDAMSFGGAIFIEDEQFARHLHKIFNGFWEQ